MCPFRHHATIFGVAIGFYVALASADQGTNVVEMDFSAVPTTQVFGTPVPKTCDQPGQEVTVTVEQGRESDPFTCSSSVRATLTPDDASKNPTEGNTFTKAQCNDPQPLSRVCTGGSLVKGGDGDAETFTLKVPPSGCNPQTLYYCCEFSDQLSRANDAHPDEPLSKKEPCRIKIEIKPASTPTVADADLNPPRGGKNRTPNNPKWRRPRMMGRLRMASRSNPITSSTNSRNNRTGQIRLWTSRLANRLNATPVSSRQLHRQKTLLYSNVEKAWCYDQMSSHKYTRTLRGSVGHLWLWRSS
ncbi:hypothetical protein BESB_033930 [Besnoitia besnoiti]|uniref:SAG-related sequence n=1 Tax=Besnoitia besnoiti TaxID=94643 RepID=A0A2A9MG16_BESBE|nr:hypothetical protein BESB_033930 [Besnoitia besnoiti]PFH36935.1 hypothetical protein BESB_033930 [Besnoitia besnoiti]